MGPAVRLRRALLAAWRALRAEIGGSQPDPPNPAPVGTPPPTADEVIAAIGRFSLERAMGYPGEAAGLVAFLRDFMERLGPTSENSATASTPGQNPVN